MLSAGLGPPPPAQISTAGGLGRGRTGARGLCARSLPTRARPGGPSGPRRGPGGRPRGLAGMRGREGRAWPRNEQALQPMGSLYGPAQPIMRWGWSCLSVGGAESIPGRRTRGGERGARRAGRCGPRGVSAGPGGEGAGEKRGSPPGERGPGVAPQLQRGALFWVLGPRVAPNFSGVPPAPGHRRCR